jgi:phospholipid/cholesterol/gamma-HCH transport system ATP-binding protein
VLGDGVVAAQGTPDEMKASKNPFVRQFMDAQPDGPIPFHYPAPAFGAQLGLSK